MRATNKHLLRLVASRRFPALAVLIITFLLGCGSQEPTPAPTPTQETVVLSLRPILASTDLAVGANRVVFALLDSRSAPVRASAADMELAFVDRDVPTPKGRVEGVWRSWPTGPGGVFTAQVDFDTAGTWLVEISPRDGEAAGEIARLVFQVAERSVTPSIGSPAPASRNRTSSDVSSLEELTTDPDPDPDLYSMTIARALEAGQPLLVTFATPAFCSSATCGPQVDVVKKLKEAYGDRAGFIHVEIFSNPGEMEGDPSKGVVAEAVEEWGLPSEPWTFIVDNRGLVAAKFEGFTSYEELDEALARVAQP